MTRRYEQRLRAEAAEQTRRRILDAVAEQLRSAPTQPVSLDRVAQLAGVSRSTIYLTFGSRAGLFDALGADLLARGGFDELLRTLKQSDPRQSMRDAIAAAVRMFATHRDVLRVLHSMAQLDPDAVGGAVARMEEGRAAGMAHHARRLADHELLRPDLTIAQAADVLWTLTGFDSFDQLYTGRGRSPDHIAALLADAAEHALCRA